MNLARFAVTETDQKATDKAEYHTKEGEPRKNSRV